MGKRFRGARRRNRDRRPANLGPRTRSKWNISSHDLRLSSDPAVTSHKREPTPRNDEPEQGEVPGGPRGAQRSSSGDAGARQAHRYDGTAGTGRRGIGLAGGDHPAGDAAGAGAAAICPATRRVAQSYGGEASSPLWRPCAEGRGAGRGARRVPVPGGVGGLARPEQRGRTVGA